MVSPEDHAKATIFRVCDSTANVLRQDHILMKLSDMSGLVAYIWSGTLLHTTKEEYMNKLNISDEVWNLAPEPLANLVATYGPIKQHCIDFKDVTYPKVVSLASDLHGYATSAPQYYVALLTKAKVITDALRDGDISSARSNQADFNAALQQKTKEATDFQARAQQVYLELNQAETIMRQDQEAMQVADRQIHVLLNDKDGRMAFLNTQIDTLYKEVGHLYDEQTKDITIAATAPLYSWVPLIGVIAAVVVTTVFAKMADNVADSIDKLQGDMSKDKVELAQCQTIVGTLKMADRDLESWLQKIGPAIEAVEAMIGAWKGIADDLQGLANLINDQCSKGTGFTNEFAFEISADVIQTRWGTVAERADYFRLNAFIQPQPVPKGETNGQTVRRVLGLVDEGNSGAIQDKIVVGQPLELTHESSGHSQPGHHNEHHHVHHHGHHH